MAYESALPGGCLIVDDTTREHEEYEEAAHQHGRGLILPVDRPRMGYAYKGIARPFPSSLIIEPGPNQQNWKDRIKKLEDELATPVDLIERTGLPPKNQERTNFCWGNSPVHSGEIAMLKAGQTREDGSPWILSPASICCPVTDFENVGGWSEKSLGRMISHGPVPVEHWPANAIERRYGTAENYARGERFKIVGWYTCQPRNQVEHYSAIFLAAASVGLNYMGHQLTDVWFGVRDGKVWPLARNSWGAYQEWILRMAAKAPADDIVLPIVVMAA